MIDQYKLDRMQSLAEDIAIGIPIDVHRLAMLAPPSDPDRDRKIEGYQRLITSQAMMIRRDLFKRRSKPSLTPPAQPLKRSRRLMPGPRF